MWLILTFSNTDVEFNVRPLHVLMMSSTNRLLAHIVPVIDTMATFTSSTRNKANAFSTKKNVDVSWIKQRVKLEPYINIQKTQICPE